jgi:hypothetical protein
MVPTRLALIGFTYGQTFLFTRAINYLSEQEDTESANTGYGLIAATFIIYLGIAVSEDVVFSISLMSNLFDRSLMLSINSKYLES